VNAKDLLAKGYFPKELPPAFTTKSFADKFSTIKASWELIPADVRKKYTESKCIIYSIPRLYYSRRNLGVPNPLQQSILAESIHDNWTHIHSFYQCSKISTSKPVVDPTNQRAAITEKTFSEFKKACLIDSFDKLYEVKTDISRFYPTIYTHVIPWALHTKAIAKTMSGRNDHSLLGNILDKNVRRCQSGQTNGIPIGPDTSLIISEIIACKIDEILQDKFSSIKAYRYYDDYYFFVSTLEDAEKILKTLQHTLTDFNLDINEEKTNINKCPIPFESEWSIRISSFYFRENEKSQEKDISNFFSLSFQLAKENPKDAVLQYVVKRLESVHIFDKNWPFFESLLLKTALSEPLTLPEVTRILISYEHLVNCNKLQKVVEGLIENHISKGHSFEVSSTLWLAKTFKLVIKEELAEKIFSSNDVFSILIALDLKSNKLINQSIAVPDLVAELTEESFFEEKWLLTYESIIKKWLEPSPNNLLDKNPFFKLLKDNNVTFYDVSQQLESIKLKKSKSKIGRRRKAADTSFLHYLTSTKDKY